MTSVQGQGQADASSLPGWICHATLLKREHRPPRVEMNHAAIRLVA